MCSGSMLKAAAKEHLESEGISEFQQQATERTCRLRFNIVKRSATTRMPWLQKSSAEIGTSPKIALLRPFVAKAN